jgi:tetratricopeptide (TPR) repeat protein
VAIGLFDKILNDNPQIGEVYLNRGLVRELTGDLDGACKDWNMALELNIKEAARYLEECK